MNPLYHTLGITASIALAACAPSPQTLLSANQNRARDYLEQCDEYHRLVTQNTWRELNPQSCDNARIMRDSLQNILHEHPELRSSDAFDADLMRRLEGI